jgi:hypothetical protein
VIHGTIQIQEVYASVYSQRIFVIQLEVKYDQNHQFIQTPFLLDQLIIYLLQESEHFC